MSYQVLARKWRPGNFDEMVGQAHVLRALSSSLDNERLHHAYLFTGTRGVGKTTIARILARCLNCEQGISSKPCGTCSACMEINEGRFVDLIEVDAASRTKVEDTRELLENVQYRPTRGRYKVYLIDEVHMLSNHSFNALLKTLEEPPPHVVFLLATTDPQKLLPTVLSRCLQFHLKNMQPDDISGHLAHILKTEDIEFDEAALGSLAWSAKGSMRDALSLLDQAIAFGNGTVLDADVREMLGTIDRDQIYRILSAIAANDGAACMAIIDELSQFAPDYEDVLAELLAVLHRIALIQQIPDASMATQDLEQIKGLAATISSEDIQLFYQLGLHGRRDIPLAPDKRSGFEMCMLRLMNFRPAAARPAASVQVAGQGAPPVKKPESPQPQAVATADAVGSNDFLPEMPEYLSEPPDVESEPVVEPEPGVVVEQHFVSGPLRSPLARNQSQTAAAPVQPIEQIAPVETVEPARPVEKEVEPVEERENVPAALAPDISPGNWHQVIENCSVTGVTQQIALNTQFISFSGDKLTLSMANTIRGMVNNEHLNKLTAAINGLYNSAYSLSISELEPDYETPRQRKDRIKQERHQAACEHLNNDSQVQELLKTFDAKLDLETVVTLLD
ncbi:MAG: DNA polymerase III subunit gamma/tau [Gammaproteobacteria bacterium]|nr:MAG: DNA polymerase III subunit gamma/tau [Gammaproteobacteria bacterium]